MRKSLLSLILILVVIATPSFANGSSTTSINTDALDLSTVEILPDGITPIVIENQTQFDEFVKAMKTAPETIEEVSYLKNPNLISSYSTNGIITYYTSASKNLGLGIGDWSSTKLKLTAAIEIYTSGSFRQINGSTQWTNLEGYTIGLDWTEHYNSSTIQNGGQSIDVSASGTLDYYLIVNGVIKLYSKNMNISLSYRVY
ncbi:MAG: hypothetical protein IBX70_10520 [Clostridia bacterium]|nr:hypothetical protein [Clostridia bacterium]